jgi:hypothetical protein
LEPIPFRLFPNPVVGYFVARLAHLWPTAFRFRGVEPAWNNVGAVKPPAKPSAKNPPDSKMKSGLPGTPEQQRQQLRAAMEKNAETLRRLAE